MNIGSTIGRIAAVLATMSALAALAGAAQAGTSRPQSMSKAEYRALMLRGEALNQKYGLGMQKAAVVTSQPTNSTRGFAWGAFGIGAAVMFGLALLAGGFFFRHRLLTTRRRLAALT
ncbi:MAG TPA: hypothetical protein VNR63_04935 [Gaiellaceae bacterium]|nr:hypothetical protein [Gaiellaceae bacterium]